MMYLEQKRVQVSIMLYHHSIQNILGFEIDHTSINTTDASRGCDFWTTSAATSRKKQHRLSMGQQVFAITN